MSPGFNFHVRIAARKAFPSPLCLRRHSPDVFPSNNRPVVGVVGVVIVLALEGGVLTLVVGVLALWLS